MRSGRGLGVLHQLHRFEVNVLDVEGLGEQLDGQRPRVTLRAQRAGRGVHLNECRQERAVADEADEAPVPGLVLVRAQAGVRLEERREAAVDVGGRRPAEGAAAALEGAADRHPLGKRVAAAPAELKEDEQPTDDGGGQHQHRLDRGGRHDERQRDLDDDQVVRADRSEAADLARQLGPRRTYGLLLRRRCDLRGTATASALPAGSAGGSAAGTAPSTAPVRGRSPLIATLSGPAGAGHPPPCSFARCCDDS